jgi:hypothetical protein
MGAFQTFNIPVGTGHTASAAFDNWLLGETAVRITKIIILSLTVWASTTDQTPPQAPRWRAKIAESGYLRGVVVLPAARLDADLVEEVGRMALKECGECDVVYVEIYSEEDYPPSHYLALSHTGYDWWRTNF